MKAIITGVCGQDGAYLARLLLEKGYRVHGWAKRNASLANLQKLNIAGEFEVSEVDICDPIHVKREIDRIAPNEIYNLAAQSHVGLSFKNPVHTNRVNYEGYLNILHASDCKVYQAGTSEMFGYAAGTLANENTPFAPMSPYAISKVASYWAGVNARKEGKSVYNGILFNHESPLRGNDFVTRKISRYVATHSKGAEPLHLGNLDSVRDWGHAKDYVRAMWCMMLRFPDDYVIATGHSTTVRQFVTSAFAVIGKEIEFSGEGLKEVGYVDGMPTIVVNPEFYRPNDLGYLCGDATKARMLLNWQPIVTLPQLIEEMVLEDQ